MIDTQELSWTPGLNGQMLSLEMIIAWLFHGTKDVCTYQPLAEYSSSLMNACINKSFIKELQMEVNLLPVMRKILIGNYFRSSQQNKLFFSRQK